VILLLAIIAIICAVAAIAVLARTYSLPRLWRVALRAAPLRMWVLFGAGPVLTVCAGVLVYIVWQGGWPISLRDKQLSIIGVALFGTLALLALVFAKIAGAKVKGTGPLGTSLDIDGSGQ
jgi:hypothetical protein